MFVGDHNVSSSVPLISSDPVQPNKKAFLPISATTLEKRQTIFWKRFPWRTESSTGQTKDMALQKKETDSSAHALTICPLLYAIFLHNSIYGKQKISNSNYCKRIHMKDK